MAKRIRKHISLVLAHFSSARRSARVFFARVCIIVVLLLNYPKIPPSPSFRFRLPQPLRRRDNFRRRVRSNKGTRRCGDDDDMIFAPFSSSHCRRASSPPRTSRAVFMRCSCVRNESVPRVVDLHIYGLAHFTLNLAACWPDSKARAAKESSKLN